MPPPSPRLLFAPDDFHREVVWVENIDREDPYEPPIRICYAESHLMPMFIRGASLCREGDQYDRFGRNLSAQVRRQQFTNWTLVKSKKF